MSYLGTPVSDRTPPEDEAAPPPPPQPPLGLGSAGKGGKNLSGIAPAVVDAFLNANGRKAGGAMTSGAALLA